MTKTQIVISEDVFDEIKEACKPHIKDNCTYCGCEINKKTFGYLSKGITCCKDKVCLFQAISKEFCEDDN